MTLGTQIVPILVAGGLAQQTDALALEPGAWLTLDNLVYDKAGVLKKRAGYTYLSTAVQQGGTLNVVSQLATLRGQLLAVCDGTNADRPGLPHYHAWSPTTGAWVRQDDVCPATIRRSFRHRGVESVENPQMVTANDRVLLSWLEAGVGLHFKILDTDGVVLQPEISIEALIGPGLGPESASSARLVLCGTTAVWIYVNSATFELEAINYDLITGAFGAVTLMQTPFLFAYFDAVAVSGSEFVLALVVGTGIELRRINALSLAVAASSFQPAYVAPGQIGLAREEATGRLAIITTDAGPVIRAYVVTSAFGVVWGPTTLAAPTGPIERVSVGFLDSGDTVWLWSGQDGATTYARGLFSLVVDGAGVPAPARRQTWHVDLYSRPWLEGGQAYALLHGYSDDAYYLLCLDHTDDDAVPHLLEGYTAINEAAGLKTGRLFPLPDAMVVAPLAPDGRYQIPIQVPCAVTNNQRQRGIDVASLDFARGQSAFTPVEAQGCLAQGGAFAGWLDGQVCVEQGFTRAPEIVAHTIIVGGGSIAGAGASSADWNAYVYVAVYEWADAQGNIHRSEPSAPYTVGVLLVQTNARINVQIRTICTTRKGDRLDGTLRQARIALYRTKANTPEVFYRVDDPTTLTVENNTLNPAEGANDTLSDAQLVSAQFGLLYTRGDVLPDSPPPPTTALAVYRGRAWIASAEDDRAVWFSQAFFPGEAPRWYPGLQLRVEGSPSGVTALAALRDQLLIFTRDRTYYTAGDGPNDTGAGGTFAGPFLLSQSVGCLDHRSVVVFDGGALFLAEPGFYLVSSAGLQLSFVGQPVRDLTRDYRSVLGVHHDAHRSRVVWLLGDPSSSGEFGPPANLFVVFDYLHNAWSTWTVTGQPIAQTLWRGLHVWSDEAEVQVPIESPLAATDPDDAWITSTVETPWLRLAGQLGYQRTRRVLVMARQDGRCDLTVELFHDQSETVAQSRTFDLQTGALSPPPVRGLEMHVAQQKCRALKIRISDAPPASLSGPGFSLVALSLEAGIKQGRDKLPLTDRR